jgi:hypothetical protein
MPGHLLTASLQMLSALTWAVETAGTETGLLEVPATRRGISIS